MYDKVVIDFLPELEFVPDWFVRSLKKLVIFYSLIMIYSFLMKILPMSRFLVMKE